MSTITYGREMSRSGSVRPASFMGKVRNYLARTRAERQLAQLDDRMLNDIGLKRSEITSVIWGN